jgi:hypothetical protein
MWLMKKTAKNNRTRKLLLPPPGSPPSPLGIKLRRLRRKIEESGERLMTSAEIRRELLRRRGLA